MVKKTDSEYEYYKNTGVIPGGQTAEELQKAALTNTGNAAKGEIIKTPEWVSMYEPKQMTNAKEYWVSVRIETGVGIIDANHQSELDSQAKVEAWKGLVEWKTVSWTDQHIAHLDSLKIDWEKETATTAKKIKTWIDPERTTEVYFLVSVDKAAFDTAYKGYKLKVDNYDAAAHVVRLYKNEWEEWNAIHNAAVKNLELYGYAAVKHQDQDGHDWKGIILQYKKTFHNILTALGNLGSGIGLRFDFSKDYKLMACLRLPANPQTNKDGVAIELGADDTFKGFVAQDFDQKTAALIAYTMEIANITPNNAKQRSRFEFQTKFIHPFGLDAHTKLEKKFEAMEKGRLDHNQKVSKIQNKLGTTAFHGIMNDAVHRGYMSPGKRKDILDAQKDLVDFVGDAKVESPEEMCTPLKDIKSVYLILRRYDLAAQARKRAGISDTQALINFFVKEYNSAYGAAKATAKKNLEDLRAAVKLYEANAKRGLHSVMTFRLAGKKKPVPHLLKGLLAIATAALLIVIKKAVVKEIKEKCKLVQKAFDEMKCAALDNDFMTDTRKNMKKYGLFSMQSEELSELHRARDWKEEGPRPDQDALRVALKQPLNSKKAQKIRNVTAGALQDLTPPEVCGMLARDEIPEEAMGKIMAAIEADEELKDIFKVEDFPKVLKALKDEIKYSPPLVPPRPPEWCDADEDSLADAIAGRAPAELIAELEREQEELQNIDRRKLLREVFNLPPEDLESPETIAAALMQNAINEDEELNKTTAKFVDQLFDSLDISYISEARDLKAGLMKLTEMDPATQGVVNLHKKHPTTGQMIPYQQISFDTHLQTMQKNLLTLKTAPLTYVLKENHFMVGGQLVELDPTLAVNGFHSVTSSDVAKSSYRIELRMKEDDTGFNVKIFKTGLSTPIFQASESFTGATSNNNVLSDAIQSSLSELTGKQVSDFNTYFPIKKTLASVLEKAFVFHIQKAVGSPLFGSENLKAFNLVQENLEDNLFSAADLKERVKTRTKELSATLPLHEATLEAVLDGSVDAISRLTLAENVFLNLFLFSVSPSLNLLLSNLHRLFMERIVKEKLAGRKTKTTPAQLLTEAVWFQAKPFQKVFPPTGKTSAQLLLESFEERDVQTSLENSNQPIDYEKYKGGGLILERYVKVNIPDYVNSTLSFESAINKTQKEIVAVAAKTIQNKGLSTADLVIAKNAVNLSGVVNIHAWQQALQAATNSSGPYVVYRGKVQARYFRQIEIKHYASNTWEKVEGVIWLADPASPGHFYKFVGGTKVFTHYWKARRDHEQFLRYVSFEEHQKTGKHRTFSNYHPLSAYETHGKLIETLWTVPEGDYMIPPKAPGMNPNPRISFTFKVQGQQEEIGHTTPESIIRFHWYSPSSQPEFEGEGELTGKTTTVVGGSYVNKSAGTVDHSYGLRLSYVLPLESNPSPFLKQLLISTPSDDTLKKWVRESALVHRVVREGESSPKPFVVIPLASAETPPKNPLNFEDSAKWFSINYNAAKEDRLYKLLAEEAKGILNATSGPMFPLSAIYMGAITADRMGIDASKSFSNTTDAILSVYDAVDKVDEFNHETSVQKAAKKKTKEQLLKGKE